ncbi:MAG TPA: hypothetical protein VFJ61_13225 [Solirubrobacterales bacterium]|nr:hypothetical protein [Solirubrobacterales bacterium]
MTELVTFLLPALPLLGLLLALLLGHYPGCESIVRLSERIASSRRTRDADRRQELPKPPRAFAPAGGLLIALGLAQRPPPVAA